MKKILLMLLICPALIQLNGQAQTVDDDMTREDPSRFYIGLRFLPTFTDLEVRTFDNSTAETKFTVGYGYGGYVGTNFTKNVGLQFEVIYSSLAQKYVGQDKLDRKIDLKYFNFPLMLMLNTNVTRPVNFNVAFGPQLGINTGAEVDNADDTMPDGNGGENVRAVVAVKTADIGFAYGAGFDFRLAPVVKLELGFRGVFGLVDMGDNSHNTSTNEYLILDRSQVKTYAGYVGFRFTF